MSWNRCCVGDFAILTERELLKKGYQIGLQKGIVLQQVWISEVIQKLSLWVYLVASEELVWTQTAKWIRRWACHDLNIKVLLETCVLFQTLLLAWKEEGIWRSYFICLWFSVKSKQWYQLPWKHIEISWWKVINYTSKITSVIVCGKFPKLDSWNNFFQ